jgi:uncharacterized protein (PEP-CTERM system associated)
MAITKPERRGAARLARASASGLALLSIGATANAATSPALQPTLAVSAVATDNSELVADAQRRSDVIGNVDAGILVRSRGARLKITGDAGLQFVGYARHTESDRVLPRGQIDLNAILLERALFFDGEVSAVRTRSDPLAAQSDTASTANTVSTVSLRASPYFAHEFSDTLSATARSDTTVTRNKSADASGLSAPNGSTNQHDVVRIVRKPVPFGFSIDAVHDDTTYQEEDSATLRSDSLQATLNAAIDSELIVGVVGGREHVVYPGSWQNDTVYGAALQWHPSKRMAFDVDAEHHYFGTGWSLHFRDRLPRTTVDLSLTRTASATSATFGVSGPDSNPAALLGALLSSRTPEGATTDAAVDDLVRNRNLPGSFSQPLQITSESAQIATRANLNLIYNGARDTVYLSAWYLKATALPAAEATAVATTFDSRQWGGSLGLYHRLMPTVSAAAQIEWSTIEALGTRTGDSSRQVTGTLSLTQRLGPRTSVSCGLRHFASHVVLNSTSTTTDVRENQAFAGLRLQY